MKQTIQVKVDSFCADRLDGPLEDAIKFLDNLRQEHPNQKLRLESNYDDDGFSGDEFKIYEERLETDEEEKFRLITAQRVKEHIERMEREELAKLKAKYG